MNTDVLERLRSTTRVKTLPKQARVCLEQYLSLPFNPSFNLPSVSCPYWINDPPTKRKGAVYRGKGAPMNIATATFSRSVQIGEQLNDRTAREIQAFMQRDDVGLGIDCSGFIYHVLDAMAFQMYHAGLDAYLNLGGKRFYQRWRQVRSTRVSSWTLISDRNCVKVPVEVIKPGDIISSADGAHVLLIVEVGNQTETASWFRYAESTSLYAPDQTGVREGLVTIPVNQQHPGDLLWLDDAGLPDNSPTQEKLTEKSAFHRLRIFA